MPAALGTALLVAATVVGTQVALAEQGNPRAPLSPYGEGGFTVGVAAVDRRITITSADDGSYALGYTPAGADVVLDLDLLSGDRAQPWWYDPTSGRTLRMATLASDGVARFAVPKENGGPAWVLVVDDIAAGYGSPDADVVAQATGSEEGGSESSGGSSGGSSSGSGSGSGGSASEASDTSGSGSGSGSSDESGSGESGGGSDGSSGSGGGTGSGTEPGEGPASGASPEQGRFGSGSGGSGGDSDSGGGSGDQGSGDQGSGDQGSGDNGSGGDGPGGRSGSGGTTDDGSSGEGKPGDGKSGEEKPGDESGSSPKSQTPEAADPTADKPEADTPKSEDPKSEDPGSGSPKEEAPKEEPPKEEPPQAEPPKEAPKEAPEAGGDPAWDKLAQCESTGNWEIDSGNGYYGGLQFDKATWNDFGGTQYAPRADQASKDQQIEIASKVRDARGGYSSWPACSSKLGLPK